MIRAVLFSRDTRRPCWTRRADRVSRVPPPAAAREVRHRHGLPVGTTHHIDPDLDAMRTTIATPLEGTGLVGTVEMEPGMGATTTGKNAGGDRFFTDGQTDRSR